MRTPNRSIIVLTIAIMTMAPILISADTASAASLTWDANGVDVDVTDGGGTWLTAGQWWDELTTSNVDWTAGDDAIIGVGGEGGTITLGDVTAGSVLLDDFTGTYTLNGGSLDQSGGLTIGPDAGNVTINSTFSGTGGLTINAPVQVRLGNNTSFTHSGDIIINAGELLDYQFNSLGTGNLNLNGGVLVGYWGETISRDLGAGPGQIQVHGVSGFTGQGSNGSSVNLNGGAAVQWGSTFFDPTTLVLQSPWANTNGKLTWKNQLDLNGGQRIIATNKDHEGRTDGYANISGLIVNDNVNTPGGITKIGVGRLILSNKNNSYDGPTIVNEGILQIGTGWQSSGSIPGGIGNATTGSNLEINDASLAIYYQMSRTLGTGPGQIQITGGRSALTQKQGDRAGWNVNGVNDFEVVWGAPEFDPTILVLSDPNAGPARDFTLACNFDLNGDIRTIETPSTVYGGLLPGAIGNNDLGATGGLNKTGAGKLILQGTNTYDGGTTISEGTLLFTKPEAMPGFGVVTVNAGATLAVTVDGWADGPSANGTIAGLLNGLGGTTGGTVTLDPGAALDLMTNGTSTLATPLSGAAPLGHAGPGTLILSGDNIHTGGTISKGGTLQLSHAGALGGTTGELIVQDGSVVLDTTVDLNSLKFNTNYTKTVSGGTLNFSPGGTIAAEEVPATITSGIAGLPTINSQGRGDHGSTLLLAPTAGLTQEIGTLNAIRSSNNRNTKIDLGGESVGNTIDAITWTDGGQQLSLTKIGSGTWTVGGGYDNGPNGDTRIVIDEGTLVLTGGTFNPSHQLDINDGAILAGDATVSVARGGAEHVRLMAGGAIAPGIGGIGTLTVDGQITLSSNDTTAGMLFDLSTTDNTGDLLDITGAMTKGAGSSFIFDFAGATGSQTYTLANFASTDFVAGDFAATPMSLGGSFVVSGTDLQYVTVAAVQRWTGTVDGDYAAANWSYGGVGAAGTPVVDEHMTISSGNAIVSTPVTPTAASLKIARFAEGGAVQINAGASLAVTGPIQVRKGGALNVDGTLTASTIRVDTGSTVSVADTADFKVSDQAVIGDTIVATIDAPANAFNVSGADVLTERKLTLNGGTLTIQAPIAGGNLVMPAGLEAHFAADQGVSVDGSNNVTVWADQSGNGRDAIAWQGTGTLTPDEINNKPAVLFTENENLDVTGTDFFAKDTVLVFRSTNGENFRGWSAPFGEGDNVDANRTWMFANNSMSFWNGETPEAVTWNSVVVPIADTTNMTPTITGAGSNAGEYMILKVTAGAESGTQLRQYALGTRNKQWSDGKYATAEVLAFADALSPEDENNLGGYLAAKYGITAAGYTGNIEVAPTAVMLPNTTIATTADSTVTVANSEALVLGGVDTAAGTKLTIDSSATAITLTNMTLGGGSVLLSTQAAGSGAVSVTVAGTLTGGDSVSYIGDVNDAGETSLTMAAGSTYDFTVAGSDSYVDATGAVTLEAGITINVDGSASATPQDVKLLYTYTSVYDIAGLDVGADLSGLTVKPSPEEDALITINMPLDWNYTSLGWLTGQGVGEDEDYLMLLGVTGTGTGSVDGDANNNQVVDEDDMAILLAQFGSPYDMARAGDNADFNGDGYVNMADFVILRANWGAGTPVPGASELPSTTPEPATMTMLALGAMVAIRRRRRK
jgi:autotransporter-associated beta strand protein